MIEIPAERLTPELLDAVIEAFVLREGTDYGEREATLDSKIAQVRAQIARGEVLILFDSDSETCNLVTRREYREMGAR